MTDKKLLALIKKEMSTWQGKTRWWQVRDVYKKSPSSWSKWDKISNILWWWWRIFPFSIWSRQRRLCIRLEEKIAHNELYEIQKLFNLNVGLYMLANALKKKFPNGKPK